MGIVAHYYIAGKKTRKMIRDDMERDELYSKNRFINHCKIERPHIWFKDKDQKRWIH